MLRGAIGEIEDFARVELVTDSPDFVQGTAVADVTHMLAELIENAVQYSPPGTKVQVRGGRVANGYVIEVEDRGLGIPLDIMQTLNERLAKPPEFDLADSDQLGLFVVSRLAARHSVKISLRVSGYGGTSAVVLLPRTLVVAEDEVPALAGKAAKEAQAAARAARGRLGVVGSVRWRSGARRWPAAGCCGRSAGWASAPSARARRRPQRAAPTGPRPGQPACRAGRRRPAWRRSCARTARPRPRDRWRAAHPSRPGRSCPPSSRDCGAAAPPVHLTDSDSAPGGEGPGAGPGWSQ